MPPSRTTLVFVSPLPRTSTTSGARRERVHDRGRVLGVGGDEDVEIADRLARRRRLPANSHASTPGTARIARDERLGEPSASAMSRRFGAAARFRHAAIER